MAQIIDEYTRKGTWTHRQRFLSPTIFVVPSFSSLLSFFLFLSCTCVPLHIRVSRSRVCVDFMRSFYPQSNFTLEHRPSRCVSSLFPECAASRILIPVTAVLSFSLSFSFSFLLFFSSLHYLSLKIKV